ncbi:MAG: ankyrin repeat domain-containing protein, partial [Fimbriiglobus sp.]
MRWAICRGDLATVRRLLAAGADPNSPDPAYEHRPTPLHMAAEEGSAVVVKALLAAGGDLNRRDVRGRQALHHAAAEARAAAVEVLLVAGADPNAKVNGSTDTPLALVLFNDIAPVNAVVVSLLQHGASATKEDPTRLSYLSQAAGKKVLVPSIRALVAAGADVNEVRPKSGTALHWAVGKKQPENVRTLLDLGADPATRTPPGHPSHPGLTAAEYADTLGYKAIAKLIREYQPSAGATSPAPVTLPWAEFVSQLRAHAPDVAAQLRKPATKKAVADLAKHLKAKALPPVPAGFA